MSWIAAGAVVVGAGLGVAGSQTGKGSKPKVPTLKGILPENVQDQTIAGNVKSFESASKLAAQVDLFNNEQLAKMQELALPGGRSQIQKNILSQLQGNIPDDVSQAVQRSSAQRGVAGGFGGSGFGANLTTRDLGLTSLQLTQQGFDSAQKWIQLAAAPTFDVTSMFFTPQQRLGFEMDQQAKTFDRDWLAARTRAMPDPKQAALGDFMTGFGGMLAGFGLGGAKGVGGGFGGGGAAQDPYAGPGYGPSNEGGSWGTRVMQGGFQNNWYLGRQPGPG